MRLGRVGPLEAAGSLIESDWKLSIGVFPRFLREDEGRFVLLLEEYLKSMAMARPLAFDFASV
jgi:hypothetical protein